MSRPQDGARHSEDEEDDDGLVPTPPIKHRSFGAGLHKRKIAFVPASTGDDQLSTSTTATKPEPTQDISSIYLNLVLSKTAKLPTPTPTEPATLCTICNLPFTPLTSSSDDLIAAQAAPTPHTSSLAHQLCLPHSRPPSSLDRSRMGVSYLSTHGWDPDARQGLGAAGQGIPFPIKAQKKEDKLGVGMEAPKKVVNKPLPPKVKTMDAGKVRKMAQEEKKRAERIRQQLDGRADWEKYLGPGAVG